MLEIDADCLYHIRLTRYPALGPLRKTMRIK